MTRHATMTNRNDIQNSMHVLAMTWSSTTPPLGVSDTHTCSPSSEDPHNARDVCSAVLLPLLQTRTPPPKRPRASTEPRGWRPSQDAHILSRTV